MANPILRPLLDWAGRLRFPALFAITAGLFLLTLVFPDPFPLADEILLGLGTLLLGNLKRRRAPLQPPR